MNNLSPMEAALLNSLQASSQNHSKRLSDLEELLQQLVAQSQRSSDSGQGILAQLKERLDALDSRLDCLARDLENLPTLVRKQTAAYNQTVAAYDKMRSNYLTLAEEARGLRSELVQLRQSAEG